MITASHFHNVVSVSRMAKDSFAAVDKAKKHFAKTAPAFEDKTGQQLSLLSLPSDRIHRIGHSLTLRLKRQKKSPSLDT